MTDDALRQISDGVEAGVRLRATVRLLKQDIAAMKAGHQVMLRVKPWRLLPELEPNLSEITPDRIPKDVHVAINALWLKTLEQQLVAAEAEYAAFQITTPPDQTDLGASDDRPLGPDNPLYRRESL